MVVSQFLRMNSFNEPGLHAVTRGIVSVYGRLPVLFVAGPFVVNETFFDNLFVD